MGFILYECLQKVVKADNIGAFFMLLHARTGSCGTDEWLFEITRFFNTDKKGWVIGYAFGFVLRKVFVHPLTVFVLVDGWGLFELLG